MKIKSLFFLMFFASYALFGQGCPSVLFGDAEGMPGDTACVEVAFANMMDLVFIQGTISYDKEVMKFDSLYPSAQTLPEYYFDYNLVQEGDITLSGIDVATFQNYAFDAPEVAMTLCFELISTEGAQTNITLSSNFTPISIGIDEGNGAGPIIQGNICNLVEGTVSVTGSPNNEEFMIVVEVENATCSSQSGGAITASGVFGVPPYTFVWIGPNGYNAFDAEITNLEPGSYNVTATDATGNNAFLENIIIEAASENEIVLNGIFQNYCYQGNDAAIDISVNTTSNAALFYAWNNGAITQDIFNLAAGIYSVTVSDIDGCTSTAEYEITEPERLISGIEIISDILCDEGTGELEVYTAPGTQSPFTYLWSNGSTESIASGLPVGTHAVTVTDNNGCIDTESFVFESSDVSDQVQISATCSALNEDDGAIALFGIQGQISYEAAWSTGSTSLVGLENLAPGNYSVSISTPSCTRVLEATIEESLSAYQDSYQTCGLDTIQIVTESNNATLDYLWNPSNRFDDPTSPSPYYATALQDSAFQFFFLQTAGELGCTRNFNFELNIVDDCVWPGDVDLDNMVSATDLLPIGLVNGQTGPARPNASTDWSAQESILWNTQIPGYNADVMHADCNGDGVVDEDDILVIEQNNGLSHDGFAPEKLQNRAMGVPIYIDLSSGFGGDLILPAYIMLGTENEEVTDAYGVAFQIKYDINKVTFAEVVQDGWLSENQSEVWDISFFDHQNGLVDVAIVRTDGNNISGYGRIASFIPTPFIAPGMSSDTFQMDIIHPILISNLGEQLAIEGQSSQGIVYSVGVTYLDESEFNEKLFPNPASEYITIDSERSIDQYSIYNLLGEKISSASFISNINISHLDAGVYFIQLDGKDGLTRHSFVKG